jgi:hypothetical protein
MREEIIAENLGNVHKTNEYNGRMASITTMDLRLVGRKLIFHRQTPGSGCGCPRQEKTVYLIYLAKCECIYT